MAGLSLSFEALPGVTLRFKFMAEAHEQTPLGPEPLGGSGGMLPPKFF